MKLNCVLTHGVCGRGVENWYSSGAQPYCKTDEVQILGALCELPNDVLAP